MSNSTLYDDDILLWSEQQAAVIRKLGKTRRDLPNDLDIENVAEEVESVGRSELAAVESRIELILVHLIKLLLEPDVAAGRHWRSEIAGFHSEMSRRYAPSMRQRIDVDRLWQRSRRQSMLAHEGLPEHHALASLSEVCVLTLDDLLIETLDDLQLVERLRLSIDGT
jgi:hypothetical protein